MKITRFTQSCLLIEEGDSRILIDPSGDEKGNLDKFGKLDAVLYTHEHGDHFDPELCERLKDSGAAIYANQSTADKMKSLPTIVADGQEFTVAGFNIKALELPHCLMVDGGPGPQNTGYLINETLFDPGDGKELDGLQVDNLALPITGPDISFKDAYDFAKQLGAKTLIPVHYDNMGANPVVFKMFAQWSNFDYKITTLDNGESTEL
jgi:L-ascorbate metabolism protein UlaG (beta-lactamase superfamily)